MIENENKTVETPEGAGTDPVAVEKPENVAPGGVKPTEPQYDAADIAKMQSQINNLNAALKQERDAGKTMGTELKEELSRSKETIEKLKQVFSPEQPKTEEPQALTMDQIEDLLEKRDRKREEESQKEAQTKAIKTEIATLEKEWDGKNDKPKYDDKTVLAWQEQNNKLHLSPREAFNIMAKDNIIDWEIKNRMNKKPEVRNVETPGGTPAPREPKAATPQNASDLRSAVLEAMEIASNENIE